MVMGSKAKVCILLVDTSEEFHVPKKPSQQRGYSMRRITSIGGRHQKSGQKIPTNIFTFHITCFRVQQKRVSLIKSADCNMEFKSSQKFDAALVLVLMQEKSGIHQTLHLR